jgi:hypothetical protein
LERRAFADILKCRLQLAHELKRERIALVRPVQRQKRDLAIVFHEDRRIGAGDQCRHVHHL